jgi:hypothetical protein
MKRLRILKIAAVLLLLFLSLFNYSRETRRHTADGDSVMHVQFHGAAVDTLILGIAAILSARALGQDLKRLSIRFGLPTALPKAPYEILPFLFLPLALYSWSGTRVIPGDGESVTVTSGWGDPSFSLLVFLILVMLVYLAKLRKRLMELQDASPAK